MERFWNMIYYFAYIGDYKLHLLFNRINPVLLLYKLNFAKRRFEKLGVKSRDYAFKILQLKEK